MRLSMPVNSYGNAAEIEFYTGNVRVPNGVPFGSPGGSYAGSPDLTFEKSFDGNINTFFDYANGNPCFTGLDFGADLFRLDSPVANIIYRACDLNITGGGTVNNWRNVGTAGSYYDLVRINTAAPGPALNRKRFNSLGTGVRFTGPDGLKTANPMLIGLGGTSRTVGLFLNTENDSNQNYIGWGTTGYNRMFDVMKYYGYSLFPHYWGNQMYGTPIAVNSWTTFEGIFTFNAATGNVDADYYVNGVYYSSASAYLDTAPGTPLLVGTGVYGNYNGTNPFSIGGMYIADRVLTTAERLNMRNIIIQQ